MFFSHALKGPYFISNKIKNEGTAYSQNLRNQIVQMKNSVKRYKIIKLIKRKKD